MAIKRILIALCALTVFANSASAEQVSCKSASGTLDPLGYKLDLKIAFNAGGYYAGFFTFDEKTYSAFGSATDEDDPEINLQMFENGCICGELKVMYEEDKDICSGTFEQDGRTFDVEMGIKPGGKMDDPFEHPSLDGFSRYSVYHFQIESGDYFFAKSMILVKDNGGFAFCLAGTDANGYGSVRDFRKDSWTVLPYRDGKITYKDPSDDTFVIEFFKDFIIARCIGAEEDYDTNAAIASGVYMLTENADSFNMSWLSPEGESDESPVFEPALTNYWPDKNYPDVEDIRNHIKAYDIDDLRIPVDLQGAVRPNIAAYFRAVAHAFNKGLLGKALKASEGRAGDGIEWVLDSRNGYCKCTVPDKTGQEGIEMCFWRGREGKDIVALNMRYIGVNPNDESDKEIQYLGVFFIYDPSAGTLKPVSTIGNNTFSLFQSTELYSVYPDDEYEVFYMKLPREGRTIEFLSQSGDVRCALLWNVDKQWFDWVAE